MAKMIHLIVNGEQHAVPADPERSLLIVLREELGLTGAKYGCAAGACGACTVLAAGEPVRACVTGVKDLAGRAVTTIEGLAPRQAPHPVQAALAAAGAAQCGYCTPGMVLGAAALLAAYPDPSDAQIVRALDGNICRCCAYPRILRAVRSAARAAIAGGGAQTQRGQRLPDAAPVTGLRTHADGALLPQHGFPERNAVPPRANAATGPPVPWDLQAPEERDYFGVLPDGLICVLPPAPSGRPGPWRANGGVWVHVGADGSVTAFAGKVDVGQDNTTALAMLVAEELRVPLRSVRMVLGDTDICPFDIGTFGSRSMPDTGQALAAAAAGARQELIALAATGLELDPSGLSATDGVVKAHSGAAISYGDLLRGQQRIVTAAADVPLADRRAWRTAGQPVVKAEAADAAAGTKWFTSDLTLPGMLHGKVLRPPAYGATLRAADLSRARAVPGAVVVHEGDFAGVAAPDPLTAAHAVSLIGAEWDVQPQPGEDDLASYLRDHPLDIEGWGGRLHHETGGDVAAALETADVQVAATYSTAYVAHVPLEPRAALAHWSQGRLTVWTGTQRPFGVRQEVARELGVDEARVRVIVAGTGCGFGGKHAGPAAAEAARLARAAGRPVKVQWSREEEFTWGYFRPAAIIDVRSGTNIGARAGSPAVLAGWEFINLNSGAAAILTPYRVPAQRIVFQPAQSPLPQGSYRALAATANNFARESHMDEIAYELGIDPLEFRLSQLGDDRLGAVLRAAAQRAGWDAGAAAQGAAGDRRGLGIACGLEKDGRVATCIEVSVTPAGRLEVRKIVTAYDCGAVVNPDNVVNQIEGATVMALGGALFEAVHFGNGVILNASLAQYRVPRFSDVPPIEVILLGRRDIPPAGAGETPVIAVAPALANAVFAATGRRLRSMPLLPEGTIPGPL
jgi:CO/xanthine dehydrogenase Mo-binding subunit/aerobic-type carbon monoxide dehydrogenase small subunit (CoxS/CutS family)